MTPNTRQRTNVLLLIFVFAFLVVSGSVMASTRITGKVTYVHDGDTLFIWSGGKKVKVRLAEIDAPETDQAGGTESTSWLKSRVEGKTVTAIQVGNASSYGRPIVYIMLNDVDVNYESVCQGMSWASTRYAGARYRECGKKARDSHLGIFSQQNPIPPWVWRKIH